MTTVINNSENSIHRYEIPRIVVFVCLLIDALAATRAAEIFRYYYAANNIHANLHIRFGNGIYLLAGTIIRDMDQRYVVKSHSEERKKTSIDKQYPLDPHHQIHGLN